MTSLIVSESCTRANKRARGSAFPSLGRSGGLQLEACWDTLLRAWLLDFASVRPMVPRQSELHRVLGLLANDLPKPEWVALVDQNGLIVACVPPEPPVETERISAMTAASGAMGDRVLRELEGGGLGDGMSIDRQGRVAIVTGGARGIGRSIALAYAEAGAKVVVASRKQEGVEAVAGEITAHGGTALAVAAHVGQEEAGARLVDRALGGVGGVGWAV